MAVLSGPKSCLYLAFAQTVLAICSGDNYGIFYDNDNIWLITDGGSNRA